MYTFFPARLHRTSHTYDDDEVLRFGCGSYQPRSEEEDPRIVLHYIINKISFSLCSIMYINTVLVIDLLYVLEIEKHTTVTPIKLPTLY